MRREAWKKKRKITSSSKQQTLDSQYIFRLPGEHAVNLNKDHFHSSVPSSSSMPLPPGLLPVGDFGKHVPMKGTHSTYDMTKPPQAPATGLSMLNNQYSPLEWSEFFDNLEMIDGVVPLYKAGNGGHMFVCLHGAGHSALSFAALAEKLKTDSIVYAFDFRGHGKHFCDNETDLSQETLIQDTLKVLEHVHKLHPAASINLVGHSMGGSIATKTAYKIQNEMKDSPLNEALLTLFIIDVVEGTALEALPFME